MTDAEIHDSSVNVEACDLRRAADVLDETPSAARAVFRDVDGRTLDEIVAALRVAADRADAARRIREVRPAMSDWRKCKHCGSPHDPVACCDVIPSGEDKIRARLTEALMEARLIRWREPELAREYADAVLPVVKQYAAEESAETIRKVCNLLRACGVDETVRRKALYAFDALGIAVEKS
jgi:predicted Zn-ribbon and HTH transcriptional regulator